MTTDAELLAASKRGEREAFGALVERYQSVVCAVSYSRTRDHALSEDVAQDTFLAAWRQLDQLREPSRLRSWLCGIARNLASKARRRRDRETPIDQPVLLAADNPFEDASKLEAERMVGEALERVPDTYRDALVLYYREQRSAREVAEILGISEAAVLQRLARGREYLANGVVALVESSLRGQRTRKNLAASVVAALPPRMASPVETTPSSYGGTMLKIAIAAVVLGTAGTAALVVHQSRTSSAPATSAAAPTVAAPAPAPAATRTPNRALARPVIPVPKPAIAGDNAPEPEAEPLIDRATQQRLGLDRGPSRGPATAPVTITVFTDHQCTYCGKAYGALDELFDAYPNKLRLVVKQMPVHKTSALSAEAAYAADAQGKFWEMHDLMFANHDDLSRDALVGLAQQAGLDARKFAAALDQHTYADAVTADKTAAGELEIKGTPAFVINGRRIVGFLPMANFREAIDAALKD